MGAVICIPNIIFMGPVNMVAALQVVRSMGNYFLYIYILRNKWTLLKDKFNLSVLMAHLFDAASTYVAVDFYGIVSSMYFQMHSQDSQDQQL